jgi:2-hydroxychromene-2-carboxylate isomerase
MWRDMERLASQRGLPFRRPSVFPRNGVLGARVALVAADEGWCGALARAAYAANFAEDRDIGARDVIASIIAGLERDPAAVLAQAESPENKLRLREQTARAEELGIFGSPTFVTKGELFWGDDRLDQAIAWTAR